jgi:hypothetical protein
MLKSTQPPFKRGSGEKGSSAAVFCFCSVSPPLTKGGRGDFHPERQPDDRRPFPVMGAADGPFYRYLTTRSNQITTAVNCSAPLLVAEDIQAATRYAADTIAHEETVIISRKAS